MYAVAAATYCSLGCCHAQDEEHIANIIIKSGAWELEREEVESSPDHHVHRRGLAAQAQAAAANRHEGGGSEVVQLVRQKIREEVGGCWLCNNTGLGAGCSLARRTGMPVLTAAGWGSVCEIPGGMHGCELMHGRWVAPSRTGPAVLLLMPPPTVLPPSLWCSSSWGTRRRLRHALWMWRWARWRGSRLSTGRARWSVS